jgi:hypothetical protein
MTRRNVKISGMPVDETIEAAKHHCLLDGQQVSQGVARGEIAGTGTKVHTCIGWRVMLPQGSLYGMVTWAYICT